MPGCLLRVWGKKFDVDTYLEEGTPFLLNNVFRKGERRFPNSKKNKKRNLVSGFNVLVSSRSGYRIAPQISRVARFMKKYSKELRRLVVNPAVEDVSFDFGLDFRTYQDMICPQFDYFPADFLREIGKLGVSIEVSHY